MAKVTLSQSNLKQWKKAAIGNPELSAALVNKIISELDGKTGKEKAAFQEVGVELAIEQSGLGVKMIEAASELTDMTDDDGVKNLLKKMQSGIDPKAAGNIATIVGAASFTATGGGTPAFPADDPYASNANPSDVGLAVMVLALAVLPTITDETDLDELPSTNIEVTSTDGVSTVKIISSPSNVTPAELALAAYLNLIASDTTGKFDNNMITSSIKSAFKLDGTGGGE
jgi:hypothetical protein